MTGHLTLAYIIDPRFQGGTSAAVAREFRALHDLAHIRVHAVTSRMFRGKEVAPVLQNALDDLGIPVVWDAPHVSADTVVLHNPAFLKFDPPFAMRIFARNFIVVTHENFLRPGGYEAFDAGHCLKLLDSACLALRKTLAPVSSHNRTTIADWLATRSGFDNWSLLDTDWHNICDFPILTPTPAPLDRRGRHSRPGFEKFPSLEQLDACFPEHAIANVIVGGDAFRHESTHRLHWTLVPFQSIEIDKYFEMIDFMVYFTAPTWRESFGRVLAEGIAAGKVVISDPDTASVFDGAVIPSRPAEVTAVISHFINHPKRYAEHVLAAQAKLAVFSADAFRATHGAMIGDLPEAAA